MNHSEASKIIDRVIAEVAGTIRTNGIQELDHEQPSPETQPQPQPQPRYIPMTKTITPIRPPDPDDAIRERILDRAKAINTKLLARLGTVADDLDVGGNRAALGGLDGLERQIETMRSLLLLL